MCFEVVLLVTFVVSIISISGGMSDGSDNLTHFEGSPRSGLKTKILKGVSSETAFFCPLMHSVVKIISSLGRRDVG